MYLVDTFPKIVKVSIEKHRQLKNSKTGKNEKQFSRTYIKRS
jgi:hypothetical protein